MRARHLQQSNRAFLAAIVFAAAAPGCANEMASGAPSAPSAAPSPTAARRLSPTQNDLSRIGRRVGSHVAASVAANSGTELFASIAPAPTGPAAMTGLYDPLPTGVSTRWSAGFGSTGDDIGVALRVDGSGSSVVTGVLQGSVDFGCGTLTAHGTWDVFVAKFSDVGTCIWSVRAGAIGQTGTNMPMGMALEADGSVYVTGIMEGSTDFGGGTLVSAGNFDGFVVKYSSTGTYQWAHRYGGTGWDYAYGIGVRNEQVIVTGDFEGTASFGGADMTSAGSQDVFVAAFDGATGSPAWSLRYGGTDFDDGDAVAFDSTGNVYIAGGYSLTADFGGGARTSVGGQDVFIVKLSATGAYLLDGVYGSTADDAAVTSTVDSTDALVVAGYYGAAIDFGGGALAAIGTTNAFVAKFTSTVVLTNAWAGAMIATDTAYSQGLAVDGAGNVFLSGQFSGTTSGGIPSAGGLDMFVCKYASTGERQWIGTFGGAGDDQMTGQALTAAGNLVATGSFSQTVDFGNGARTSSGNADVALFSLTGI